MQFRSERHFTDAVVDLAKMNGWRVMHMRGNTQRLIQGHAGYVDLTLAKRLGPPDAEFGIVEFWELKMPKGELTEEQAEWGRALGVRWRCYRPADWDEIVKVLSGR